MAATFDAILRINAKATGDADIRRLSGAMKDLERAGDGVKSALGGLAAAVGVVGFAALGQSIARTGIESQQATVRIKALAGSYGEIEGVTEIAARAAQQFALSNVDARNAVTDLYGRLRPMGVSLKDVETVFFGVNKAAKLVGASTEDANEVMRQLSQAMGSGKLQAEDLIPVMQRMPIVGQAVAKVMGVTVGEIRKLGSEGKITTEVMIQAAAELNKIKPPEPTPFQRFSAAQKDLQQTLGEILLPTLTKVTVAAVSYAERVQSFLERNREGLTKFAQAIVETTGALVPILGRAAAVVLAFKAIQGAITAATLATKAFALVTALTPQGMVMLLASASVGLIAFQKLKGALDSATEGVKGMADNTESAESITKRLQDAWNSVTLNVDSANKKTDDNAKKTETAKKKAERYEKLIAAATRQTNAQYDLGIRQINLRTAAIQHSSSIAVEQNNLQVAYNTLGQTILQNKLALAKTDQERMNITRQIAAMEEKAARLQYEATMLQIRLERELLAVKAQAAQKEQDKATAALRTAQALAAQGRISAAAVQPLQAKAAQAAAAAQAASRELQQFNQRAAIQGQIADVNRQIASVRAQGQVQQAQSAMQSTAQPAAQPMGQPRYYIETPSGRIPQFATGAYVTRRTLAEIADGGEPEYVVPESKALMFANNIVAGRRGAQALESVGAMVASQYRMALLQERQASHAAEINRRLGSEFRRLTGRWAPDFTSMLMPQAGPVSQPSSGPIVIEPQLTGPIMEFNGQRFVTYEDLERAMRATAEGVIGRMRTPQARIALGSR